MQENNFTEIKIYRAFSRFLKNNRCFYSFFKYLYVFRKDELKLVDYEWIKLYKKLSLKPSQFIVTAFMWDRTREKESFWREMHNKWVEYYYNIN